MKGLLALAALPFRKTYNLDKLSNQIADGWPELARRVEPLRWQTSWNFAFRYPGAGEESEPLPSSDELIEPAGGNRRLTQRTCSAHGLSFSCWPGADLRPHWLDLQTLSSRKPRPPAQRSPRCAAPSFHFAMRSERANEPTLSCGTPQPTARWTMVDVLGLAGAGRDDAAPCRPACAASQAASVSVSVPRWFGLSSTVLQAPAAAAARTRPASVTRKSSPTTCSGPPTARGERDEALRVVLGQRVLDRDDRDSASSQPEQQRRSCPSAVELAALQAER